MFIWNVFFNINILKSEIQSFKRHKTNIPQVDKDTKYHMIRCEATFKSPTSDLLGGVSIYIFI